MSDNQLVPAKPILPVLLKHSDNSVSQSPVIYEKIDQSHYSFTYSLDEDINIRMEESDNSTESYEYIESEFDASLPESYKVYCAVAAASGVLTGIISMVHLSEDQLKIVEEWKDAEWKPIIINVANFIGYQKNDYKGASKYLVNHAVKTIKNNEKTTGLLTTVLSQHPSLAGLVFSVIAQFSGKDIVISENGTINYNNLPNYYVIGKGNSEKLVCAVLYWLFSLSVNEVTSKRHIIDELGVSKDLIKKIKEFANLPLFNNLPSNYLDIEKSFSEWMDKTINGIDIHNPQSDEAEYNNIWVNILRVSLNIAEDSFPVLANECIIYGLYILLRVCYVVKESGISTFEELSSVSAIDIVPTEGRLISKMYLVGSASFVGANITGAIVKAIKEKRTNDRKFSDTLFAELSIPGIGRFLFACAADSKYWGEDLRVLFQRKTLSEDQGVFSNIDSGEAFTPLTLDVIQARILYSLENIYVKYDIEHSKKKETKENKKRWLDDWKATILLSAGVPDDYCSKYFVEDENLLYDGIFQLSKDKTNWRWFYLLTQEIALFKPYYAMGSCEDKLYRKLKVESDYLTDQFVRRQTIASQAEVEAIIRAYSKYKGYVSGSTQNKIVGAGITAVAAVATGGVALTFAPGIAAAIASEAVLGLHGAALTSASLAFVGGGSLAAGGLGMAGGTAIITGGGALLGLVGSGTASTVTVLLQTPSEYWVRQSAKLLTYSDCILSQILNDKNSVSAILQQVEKTVVITVEKLKVLNEEDNDLDNELIKKTNEYLKYLKRCRSALQKIVKE